MVGLAVWITADARNALQTCRICATRRHAEALDFHGQQVEPSIAVRQIAVQLVATERASNPMVAATALATLVTTAVATRTALMAQVAGKTTVFCRIVSRRPRPQRPQRSQRPQRPPRVRNLGSRTVQQILVKMTPWLAQLTCRRHLCAPFSQHSFSCVFWYWSEPS